MSIRKDTVRTDRTGSLSWKDSSGEEKKGRRRRGGEEGGRHERREMEKDGKPLIWRERERGIVKERGEEEGEDREGREMV